MEESDSLSLTLILYCNATMEVLVNGTTIFESFGFQSSII